MNVHIKVMQRIQEENKEQTAITLFSFISGSVPRVGEIIDFGGIHEIVQVIYTSGNTVILEVKEYKNPTNPVITTLN